MAAPTLRSDAAPPLLSTRTRSLIAARVGKLYVTGRRQAWHVTQTDMHVQHSAEQTACDQLVISQLSTDSAQVAPTVESMPEQAIVNSTTQCS